ncbi:MAG: TonB-dependent receptor [Chitinophaga sp.]|uniref:SusC/RagA family TonB-linked outer membrane protein n=1 Tax=Chitinophaga sp. TaxID=1869181 RepID=UPI001B232F6B|nr:TonB-dependent receptor [Chitinophaga sp.]MBO9732795.1 TonB-dependent receptor [Chitinophaga sp.]
MKASLQGRPPMPRSVTKSGWSFLFFFFSSIYTLSAQKVITGKVTAFATGKPLAEVNVVVKGTPVGTTTYPDGTYAIKVEQNVTLVFTYVGYETQLIPVGNQTEINVALKQQSSTLGDVVVVGFGKQKKISVTGAISSVPVNNLQRIATPSLSNALAGSMPGIITRQSSGEPGYDGAAVFIRGFGTWANRSPLILVDGVERDINNLNTQEIESFSILKDASATAVYGVRGANGVILITTKRGKVGKPAVVFRTENATLTALRLPNYINGAEYAGLVNEALSNDNLPLKYTSEELQKFKDHSDPYLYPDVNWTDAVLKKNTFQSINNLSVTGGNEIIKYYTNVGYTILNGIYKQDPANAYKTNAQMKRYNFRSNVDINVSKTISLELGVGGVIQQGNYPGTRAPDIFDALKITSPINYPKVNPDNSIAGASTSYLQNNPWGLVTRAGYTRQDMNTLQGTFSGKWDLSSLVTEGLSVRGMFSYDHTYFASTERNKQYAIQQYRGKDNNGNDQYAIIREEQPMGYRVINRANRAVYTELAVNYNRSFGAHNVTGMLLGNRREYIDLTANSTINNLPYRRQGLAGRLTYNFKNRYLAEVNAGYNGSENFPEGKQYGFFPSVSAGWVISNENFWSIKAISNLKIRGSYGQVGNDQISIGTDTRRFLFLTTINRNGQDYLFGDNQRVYDGFDEAQLGNNDVTWEVANKANLGLDLELFNGAITLQVDGFKENRTGILIQRGVIPRVTGYFPGILPYANLGKARNSGVDALLEVKRTTRSGFFYNIRGTFTYARSICTQNDDPIPKYAYQSFVGQPIDQPMGLVALGFFKDQADIDKSPKQTFMEQVRPGDIKYEDKNGDNIIDDYDRVPIGYPRTPQIVYGAGASFGYKGFELSFFFTGAAQASLFVDGPSMYAFAMGLGTFNILHEYYDNRWTPGNPNAKYPRVSPLQNPNNNRTSTMFLQNAAYLRLKSAEVAYNIHLKQGRRAGPEGIRIFVNGFNLMTWDKIKAIDPESEYGTGGYPLQRSVNFGTQLTF